MNKVFYVIVISVVYAVMVNAFSFNVDKPGVTLVSRPGKTLDGFVEVVNNSQESLHFTSYLNDWEITVTGAKQFFPAGSRPLSCSGWLAVSPREFDLLPGKKMKVNYVMTVPQQANGGHYAVLFFETQGKAKKANVVLSGRIGTVFYHQVMGTEVVDASLSDLDAQADTANIYLKYAFQNKGNLYMLIKPTLAVLDAQGKIVYRKKLDKFGIMPSQNLVRQETVAKSLPRKSYTAVVTAEYGEDSFKVLEKEFSVTEKTIKQEVVAGIADEPQDASPDTPAILKFTPQVHKSGLKLNLLLSGNDKVDVKLLVVNQANDKSDIYDVEQNLSLDKTKSLSKVVAMKLPKGKYTLTAILKAGRQKIYKEQQLEIR